MSVLGNSVTQQSFTPAVDVFSGNGSTTAFTLSRPVAAVTQVEAFIENVPQSPVDAFTVNGSTITFTSAPPSGSSNIYVRYVSPITQIIAPSDGTIGTSQLVNAAVTQSKLAANVVGNGPAFSAYKSANQSLAHNTATKITFDTEVYDTNNNFASSTFTPTVAGYYQICGSLVFSVTFNRSYFLNLLVYKNGSNVKNCAISPVSGNGSEFSILNNPAPIYMNGTTDSIDLYAYSYDYSATAGTIIQGTSLLTTFGAYLVRAA